MPTFYTDQFIVVDFSRAISWLGNRETLKRGVFTSVDELEQEIIAYINANNENLKPFVWTKSAEDILEKVNHARSTLDKLRAN